MTGARSLVDHAVAPRRVRALPFRSPWFWLVASLAALLVGWLAREWLSPYGASEVRAERIMLPVGSPGSPLGTDNFGRDLLSRLLAGGPISIASGIIPAAGSMSAGIVIGLISGYIGGAVDRVLMGIMDVLLAFPFILLALLGVAILGPSFGNAMLAVAIAILPRNARIIRAETLSLRERDYVIAARLSGAGPISILARHMLPNVLPTALVVGSAEIGQTIAITAGLSYLGLGIQPPDVDWGALIADGGALIAVVPTLALIPSALVALFSILFVLSGDDIRRRLTAGSVGPGPA